MTCKNVDVLLMTPPCIELYAGMREIAPISPPLGLLYIAAVLEKNDIKIKLVDTYAENLNYKQIEKKIQKYNPLILGLTCVTSNFNEVLKISEIAKKINPNMLVVVGGPHVSAIPKETLQKNKNIDIVTIGEGDYTLLDVHNAVKGNTSLEEVRGIAFRKGKDILVTNPRELISNLDELPLPARHLLKQELYKPSKDMSAADSFFTILSSRGCPNACTFCASKILFGMRVRYRSPESIIEEIKQALSLFKTKQIVFMDDTFTTNKQRVMKICNLLKKFNIQWGCLARVNTVDDELLRKMKWSGCNWIGYGVESGSQEILNKIKKGITLEQVRKAFRLTKKAGIPCTAFFILGHLDETKKTINETIKFSKELDATFAQFNILTPYPGTEVYSRAVAEGRVTRGFEKYGNPKYKDPVIKLSTMTDKELKEYWKRANRGFYFRPKVILRLGIKALTSTDEMKRLFSMAKTFLKIG